MTKKTATNNAQQTSPHITYTRDGEQAELFMSFGLLDALTRIIKDPANIGGVHNDPDLRDDVLRALLAERTKSGKIVAAVEVIDLEISIEDIEALLDWATEHVMNFFVRSLKKVVGVTERHKTDMEDLASFLAGSSASPSSAA